jgi:hypothetical protein
LLQRRHFGVAKHFVDERFVALEFFDVDQGNGLGTYAGTEIRTQRECASTAFCVINCNKHIIHDYFAPQHQPLPTLVLRRTDTCDEELLSSQSIISRIRQLPEPRTRLTWGPVLRRIRQLLLREHEPNRTRPPLVPVLRRIHPLPERGLYHTLLMPGRSLSHNRRQSPGPAWLSPLSHHAAGCTQRENRE